MTIQSIAPQQARELLEAGKALLVDVREADEFKASHIPLAISLPLKTMPEYMEKIGISPDTKIIFQCQKGGRGSQACATLAEQNPFMREIYNLDGGILAWQSQGYPVISTQGVTGLSIFRQVQIIVGALVLASVLAGFAGWQGGFVMAGLFGGALCLAGLTGWCGMALLLGRMPWNIARGTCKTL